MLQDKPPFIVLMADDDDDDRLLAQEAMLESSVNYDIHFVGDGIELMEYLRNEGKYTNTSDTPTPNMILLDLNMPRKDGREVLAELKADPALAMIPVVILTTSNTAEDIAYTKRLGATSYQTKPVTFSAMVNFMETLPGLCEPTETNDVH